MRWGSETGVVRLSNPKRESSMPMLSIDSSIAQRPGGESTYQTQENGTQAKNWNDGSGPTPGRIHSPEFRALESTGSRDDGNVACYETSN